MAGKVFKFGANAATCIEKIKSNNREKHLEALQSAFTRLKLVTRIWISILKKMNNEIEKKLKECGEAMVGEVLIRPSGKNADFLAVH